MPKRKKLSLGNLTVTSFVTEVEGKIVKGGHVTYLSDCCTVNMSTCLVLPDGCFRTDTYQPGGTPCP